MKGYVPPDLLEANRAWGCNCGPGALAATLCVPCALVRPHFGPKWPGYTTPSAMRDALDAAGVFYTERCTNTVVLREKGLPFDWFPDDGLCFVQWLGPWSNHRVPTVASYRHTHWVGCRFSAKHGPAIYDVNAGWLTRPEWECDVVPQLLAAHPGATGWAPRLALCFTVER